MSKITRQIVPVIMAGGTGTRLWPLSRAGHPKQFLALNGKRTLLQQTAQRVSELPVSKSITICNEEHRFLVAEQLREIDALGKVLLEPVGRNTAPAIALAALAEKDDDPLLLVLAADHLVADQNAFNEAVLSAVPLAEAGRLVTFGVVPSEAHTGYGYIKAGDHVDNGYVVSAFKEKPDQKTANQYMSNGGYYWNSGMFLFRSSTYLDALVEFRPKIASACIEATKNISFDLDFTRINADAFAESPSESIDYAVMENTDNAVVVPMNAGWSDIGSWESLWAVSSRDSKDNLLMGDAISVESERSYIRAEHGLVAVLGLQDVVVVSTKDATLVAHKSRAQDAGEVVKILREEGRPESNTHREVYRPWGKYDSVDHGDRYQVKRITVKPGEKLSVQMHHHRAEHWIVVSGSANVTIGDQTSLLVENESAYIPIGAIHCLENPGKVDLELIEVQSGSYLGEDDIVRFSDIYGRAPLK